MLLLLCVLTGPLAMTPPQVTIDYLSGLHTKHEEWLAHPESLVRLTT